MVAIAFRVKMSSPVAEISVVVEDVNFNLFVGINMSRYRPVEGLIRKHNKQIKNYGDQGL